MRSYPAMAAIVLIHLLLSGQTSTTKTQLLAEYVMDKSVEATGGSASPNRVKALHLAGDVYTRMLAWSRIGSVESFSGDSGKYMNHSELDGHIVRRTGVDGKELWSADQMLMP